MSDKLMQARQLLADGVRKAFSELRSQHSDENFYAFALYNDHDGVALDGAANSEEGFRRRTEGAEDPETLRWSSAEWAYEGGFCLPGIYEMISDGEEEEDEDFDKSRGTVFAIMVLALADLEEEGFFGRGEERKKLTVFCTLSDSEHTEWLERESVRRLNPPEVFKRMGHLISDEELGEAREELGTYRVFLRVMARATKTKTKPASRSGGTRRFEFSDAKSNKFWEITVNGTEVTVRFGRIGTQGQTQTKNLPDSVKANNHADKLIEEKLTKGYQEIT